MRQYELTYLVSDLVPEAELNKVTGKVGGYVTSLDGKVLKEEIWGRRKLAYPIRKQEFATYVTVNFELNPAKAIEFEKNIFLTSKIIRHLMIVTDFGTEELKVTKEELVGTEAIEEVVGGERSFEAVEGETEESKDLMLKREAEEKEEAKAKQEEEAPAVKEEAEEIAPAKEEVAEVPEADVKTAKRAKAVKKEMKETEKIEEPEAEPAKTKKGKAPKTENEEVDRLSKLDKELDDILGDDL